MKLFLRIPRLRDLARFSAHAIFWGFNGLFVALVYFGLVPFELSHFADEARRGDVPVRLVALVVAGALVPLLAIGFALWRLRKHPRRLLAFFFGVEAPLLLGLAFCALAGKAFTAPVDLLVLGFFAGAAGHVLARAKKTGPGPRAQLLLLPLHVLGAGVGLYLAGLLAFFVPPWASIMADALTGAATYRGLLSAIVDLRPVHLLGLLLGLLSGALVLGVPAGVVLAPLAEVWRSLRALRGPHAAAAALVSLGVAAAGGLALALTWSQPQRFAFEATDGPVTTDPGRVAWRADADRIAAGLQNAFLQGSRYLERDRRSGLVEQAYRELDLTPANRAAVQAIFNDYARPFLYDDAARQMTPFEARRRYELFFDADIESTVKAELAEVAARRPWRRGQVASSVDVDARAVHLDAQEISVTERTGYADVEVHEVYRSTLDRDAEIRITFELPPSAALTGLWLGPSARKRDAFPYVIAPRGAARRTYEAQVRRNVDPALLEQVGPRQFRLRVFPIPGRASEDRRAPDVHVWLTYQALPGPDGWPTPRLIEARNLYFDAATERFVGGVEAHHEGWMPPRLLATAQPRPWVVTFEDGSWVEGHPAPPTAPRTVDARGRRVAVVLDRSYSMRAHEAGLRERLERLKAALPGAGLDVLLTSAPTRGDPARVRALSQLRDADLLAFGGHGVDLLYAQALEHLEGHAAWIVITDGERAALDAPLKSELPVDAPILVLHLGRGATRTPDAVTRAVLASGGGVFEDDVSLLTALAEAWSRPRHLGVAPGWRFGAGRGPAPDLPPGPPAVAAAWRVRALAGAAGSSASELDALHRAAVDPPVVTPWSSMIVLVNEAQREMLARESEGEARFSRAEQREVPLPQPAGIPMVSGAPEPGTWVLLALASGVTVARRRRREGSPGALGVPNRDSPQGSRRITETALRRPSGHAGNLANQLRANQRDDRGRPRVPQGDRGDVPR